MATSSIRINFNSRLRAGDSFTIQDSATPGQPIKVIIITKFTNSPFQVGVYRAADNINFCVDILRIEQGLQYDYNPINMYTISKMCGGLGHYTLITANFEPLSTAIFL